MNGDFSRLKLDALKHVEAWLQQQGRVWLDSDWNDAVLARLRLLERQNRDFIGASGAPEPGTGFSAVPGYGCRWPMRRRSSG